VSQEIKQLCALVDASFLQFLNAVAKQVRLSHTRCKTGTDFARVGLLFLLLSPSKDNGYAFFGISVFTSNTVVVTGDTVHIMLLHFTCTHEGKG
jgi:hypothetical protein